jgi:hypothetical protein
LLCLFYMLEQSEREREKETKDVKNKKDWYTSEVPSSVLGLKMLYPTPKKNWEKQKPEVKNPDSSRV